MLEAVTLLSYDMPIETKKAIEVLHSRAVTNRTVPDCIITSGAAQDFQIATGFKMLLNVTVTLAKQA